jgi:hypothetical protein
MRLSNIEKTAITVAPYLGLCSEKVEKVTVVCAEKINVDFVIKNPKLLTNEQHILQYSDEFWADQNSKTRLQIRGILYAVSTAKV